MRRIATLWALFLVCAHSFIGAAQSIPAEWEIYQSPKYFSNVQSGSNPEGLPINEYLEFLTSSAISWLARQLEVKVHETAELEKNSVDGISSVSYSSKSTYGTDVKLKLVVTKTYYSKKDNLWSTIAFIEKASTTAYFKKVIEDNLSTAERIYNNANDLIGLGYKEKAKVELNTAIDYFKKTEEAFYWLKMCGISSSEYASILSIRNDLDSLIQQKILQLGHDTTLFIKCSADCFGSSYGQLESTIKAKLSSEERSFVSNKASADWVITINATAREHNAVSYGSLSTYFTYVDAICTLYKATTNQLIYESSFTEKGGSTTNYTESAKDAYKRLSSSIINAIEDRIE